MKTILVILAIFSLSYSQVHPVPIPGLNLTNLEGEWYISWMFQGGGEFSDSSDYCIIADIDVETSTEGQWVFAVYNDQNQNWRNETLLYTVGTSNSNWNMNSGQIFDWLAVDPVAGNWATVAGGYGAFAYILTRSPGITNLLVDSQILLLKGEGYNVNSDNSGILQNNLCASASSYY